MESSRLIRAIVLLAVAIVALFVAVQLMSQDAEGADWYVYGSYAGPETGSAVQPYNTIGEAVTAEADNTDTIHVWAGGDIVTGSATVIQAMGAGKTSAKDIHEWLGKSGDW